MNSDSNMHSYSNNFGFGFEDENFICFFGNKSGEAAQLAATFSDLTFFRVRQTHSDIVIPASEIYTEADAHFTQVPGRALLIATADCMPIMIYSPSTCSVAAVHAGWRGVESRITAIALAKITSPGDRPVVFIGPSILKSSFEVDEDVYLRLCKAAVNLEPEKIAERRGEKFFVDLPKIVESQIIDVAPQAKIFYSNIDTKTDENFFSYRRGKQTSERNLSFISLKK